MIFLFAALIPEISELSLEEKIGQLLMVQIHAETYNSEAEVAIKELEVGGVIYYAFANGLDSKEKIQDLSKSLQDAAKIPLLIAVDHEGDAISRFSGDFSTFPANAEIPSLAQAEEISFRMGRELLSVGINLNLAPVIDLSLNGSRRSFGSDPETVIDYGRAMLKGFHKAGILTTLKHFPGHGGTVEDSHYTLPLSLDAAPHLLPFRALSSESDCVMTGHLLVPEIDDIPISFSKKGHALLRTECNFDGVIITDSLIMKGALLYADSLSEAALLALEGGADLLLFGGRLLAATSDKGELTLRDIIDVKAAIKEAIQAGRLSEERIDDSLTRLFALKKTGIFSDAGQENEL